MKTRVAIYGAGGHGKVIWDILVAGGHEVVGFADDHGSARTCLGLPIARTLDGLPPHTAVVIAIGDNRARQKKFDELQAQGRTLASAIHPSAILSPRLELGVGVVMAAGVIVNVDSRIGDNVILNTGATLDHDNVVGAHAHVAPGCHLAGGVGVGEGALLGIGTCAIPGVKVGEWAIAGAGSVLVRDVAAGSVVMGVPARPRAAR